MKSRFLKFLAAVSVACAAEAQTPPPDHVVIVIMENHSFSQIIGSPAAPNINALAAAGANIINDPTNPSAARSGSHALRHPSQPNYLELFSGNNQGVLQDGRPGTPAEPNSSPPPFNTPNLGAMLRRFGYNFATFSETLPSVGFDGDAYSDDPLLTKYERKHNPAVNWQADDGAVNHLPTALNQPFSAFPTTAEGFAALPPVSLVVPNQQNDMHDGSIAQGDAWLKANIIDTYLAWAQTHNSLLIVTFDEDGNNTPANQITTIFAGPMIKPGNYTELNLNMRAPDVRPPDGLITPTGTAMNHYNVLATIEDLYGVPRIGGSIGRPPVSDVFQQPVIAPALVVPNEETGRQGDVGNLFPFFSSQPIRYQQVFAAGDFTRFPSGGAMITSIAFRVHAPSAAFTGTVPQLELRLSITSKAPDVLSSTFAQNVGSDEQVVYSGPLQVTHAAGATSFDVVINLSSAFLFDPAQGNLLLEVRSAQGGTEVPPLDQELDASSASGDSVSRVYNYGDAAAANAGQTGGVEEKDTLGLVAQLQVKPPVPLSAVVSRKTHSAAGTFDIDLSLAGSPGVECRSDGSGNHSLVFTFATTLTSVGSASVTSGNGTVASSMIGSDTHQYVVNLSCVTDAQILTVTLRDVTDSSGNFTAQISVPVGILLGDANGDGTVNSADAQLARNRSGSTAQQSSFRADCNLDGTINSADATIIRNRSGMSF